MKKQILILTIGLLALSCSLNEQAENAKDSQETAIPVKVAEAKIQSDRAMLNYSGISEPALTIPLSFQLPGKVARIYVDEGNEVRKGQVLAELDKTSVQSSYDAALSMQRQAQDAYNRLKTVYDNGSLPEIKWEEVKAKLEQANSSANIAKEALNNCTITAPENGVISVRNIEEGANVMLGISAFKLISVNDIQVRISVPDTEINKIQKGQTATVCFSALTGQEYKAVVDKIGVAANQISKTFEVKLKIKDHDMTLRPGMVCEIEMPVGGGAPGLLVPMQSVMKNAQNGNYLFVVDKQSKRAKQQAIQTSGIINNQLCVTAGLNPGEWFVVEGQHKLSNNSMIKFN